MPYLSPSPYLSPGLCQAVWDALGGAKLEVGVRGKIDGAIYTVDANHQFVIPVSAGGDKVAWVRGVWLATVDFAYEGFKANPRSGQPDTTNYLTNAVRSPSGTTVIVNASLAVGTSVQVYYSKETGVLSQKGEALDGWPVLDLAANTDDYGTALDGDNYILQGLYYAFQLTGQNKYKKAAEHLAEALITWGAQEGNELTFDRKLFNQAGGDGLYNYFGGTGTTFSWDTVADPGGRTGRSLKIVANILIGGWAGWGWWPSWDMAQSPVKKVIFNLYGDGSGRKITVSSNIDPNKLSSGDVSFTVPMLAKDANAWRRFEISVRDFWQAGNIVFNGDRKDASWIIDFGNGDSTGALADLIEDNAGPEGYFRIYVKQWNYDLGLTGTYRMVSIGPGSVGSAGTTSLKMALYSSKAMDIDISVDDAFNERWTVKIPVSAGWQAISIPWTSFSASAGAPGAYPLTAGMLTQSGLDAFSATGAVDDNTGTNGWHTDTAGPGAWLQVDLGVGIAKEFVQCGLYVGPDYGPCAANYTIQYSDDAATWYNVATGFTPTTNAQWHYKSWASVGAHRYWRLYLTNTPGYGPWITEMDFFSPAPAPVLDHPITEILIGVYRSYGAGSGDIRFDNLRYDEVETMEGASIMNGLDFKMPSGNHTVYFDNVKIVQTPIDPYPLIPRWTYAWTQKSAGFGGGKDEYGYGVWRGPSAPGYLYMMGWQQYGGSLHSTILKFMKDAQDAYIARFGSAKQGPFMPRYGRWSWEAAADGVLNQWYFSGDDWHGYQWRAMVSVAYYYYLTADQTAKTILDRWIAWINAGNIISDPAFTNPPVAAWRPPETFKTDGTLSYTYTPLYAHAMIAEACIFKYWVDGDPTAYAWYRRLLDDLHYNRKIISGALAGAHESEPTGWSESEIGIALGMLINGRPGGTVNHPITPTAYDIQDFKDVFGYYVNNARDTRPSAMTSEWIPLHEYTWSSWHPNPNDVMTDDTHADGMVWTEDIGPCFFLPSITGNTRGMPDGWTSSSS